MSLIPAQVIQAQFSAIIQQSAVAPITPGFPFILPLNFKSVQNIKYLSGTFTPNSDFVLLISSFASGEAPNWMIVLCDSQLNLTMDGTFINDLAFQRFSFLSWLLQTPRDLIIEGRTTMPQNVPCNYTLIMGQGIIS